MGQYHKIVNLDKRQFLHPHELGDGFKLMEFGMSGEGGTMTALAILLAVSNGRGGGDLHSESEIVGSWGGDRIAIVGDYAEDTDLPQSVDPKPSTIFARCVKRGETARDSGPTYRDITPDVRALIASVEGVTYDTEADGYVIGRKWGVTA